MTQKIKWSEIPHLVDEQFYDMEFAPEEVEEMQAIHDKKVENLQFSPEKEQQIQEMFAQAVKETKAHDKKTSINLRLFTEDLEGIKNIAKNEGIPYQTLITSVIHKIATKQIRFQIVSSEN